MSGKTFNQAWQECREAWLALWTELAVKPLTPVVAKLSEWLVTVMATMAEMELGFARLSAILGPCAHPDAVPVELLLTGEVVAWLCPCCGRQLPAGWGTVAEIHAGP